MLQWNCKSLQIKNKSYMWRFCFKIQTQQAHVHKLQNSSQDMDWGWKIVITIF